MDPQSEESVRAALGELRRMFPRSPLEIQQFVIWTEAGRRVRWNIQINQFCISSLFGDIEDPVQPGTLERCMIAVREYYSSK